MLNNGWVNSSFVIFKYAIIGGDMRHYEPRQDNHIDRIKDNAEEEEYWERATEGLAWMIVNCLYDREENGIAHTPPNIRWHTRKRKTGVRWSED